MQCAEDIIEEIAPQLARAQNGAGSRRRRLPQQCSEDTRRVFDLLQERILQIDEVIESSGLSSAQVSEILLDLELQGLLRQLPGKRYAAEQ